MDPIYFGEYPSSMRDKLGKSLPKFTEEEIKLLHYSVDFIGLNHYTTRYVAHKDIIGNSKNYFDAQEAGLKGMIIYACLGFSCACFLLIPTSLFVVESAGGEPIGEKV